MINSIKLLRRIELEIKYGVVITDVIMTLYVLWLVLTNKSTWIIGVLFGFTPFGVIEILRASKLFHLCVCHKLMLIHTLAVYLCCLYQAYYDFGDILPLIRYIMLFTGLTLMLCIIIRIIKLL